MSEVKTGFPPVYDKDSKVLILGSFPSVKSRKIEFYYGNPQNRFWRTLCTYFGEEVPQTTEGKRELLIRHKVALWDIVTDCEIVGSQDATIKNFTVADIKTLLQNSNISYIILNGSKAYEIFIKRYADLKIPYVKLSSTSPANTHFTSEEWHNALSRAFSRT